MSLVIKTESEKVPALISTVEQLVSQASRCVVTSDEEMERATDLKSFISQAIKKVDADRVSITQPINASLREINARYKKMAAPLESALASVKKTLGAYMLRKEEEARRAAAEERRRQEEEALAAAAAAEASGDADTADLVLEQAAAAPSVLSTKVAPARGDYGGSASLADNWTYEVLDIAALAAARPDLVQVNAGAMQRAVKTDKVRDLPGVRIYNDRRVR